MDEPKKVPLVFAHQVISQFVDHVGGDRKSLDREAYQLIRVTFRRLGGVWSLLCDGDPKHLNLMIDAVRAWGKLP